VAGPVRALLGSVTGLAHTRLALLGTELREELARFRSMLIGVGAAFALGALAVGSACAAILFAVPAEQRALAALLLAIAFAAAGAFAIWRARAAMAVKPAAFTASLAELEADELALARSSAAERDVLGQSANELMRLVSIGMIAYSVGKRLRREAHD
jgi:uncharacterized membrane protein YqjE